MRPFMCVAVPEPLSDSRLRQILDAVLMAAGEPLSVHRLAGLFSAQELDPSEARQRIRNALAALAESAEGRGYELRRVASGYRYQVRQELGEWVGRLWQEKPPRYSRALLECLALIVYKQPCTRGDIEEIRGVALGQSILRSLRERGWIRELGHRETPGRPVLYGTTSAFLDYFNLQSLDDLPSLEDVEATLKPLLDQSFADDAGQALDTAELSAPIAADAASAPDPDALPSAKVVTLPTPDRDG